MPALPRLYTGGGNIAIQQPQSSLSSLFAGSGNSGLSELMQLANFAQRQKVNALRAQYQADRIQMQNAMNAARMANYALQRQAQENKLIYGSTDKEREATRQRMNHDRMLSELQDNQDFLKALREAMDTDRSFAGRLKSLRSLQAQFIDPAAKRYGLRGSDIFKEVFGKDEAYLKSEADRVQGQALESIPTRLGLGARRLYHEVMNVLPGTNEREHAQAIIDAEKEAEANNEYIREQRRRAREGEGLTSRVSGLSGWLSELSESVPEIASFFLPGGVIGKGAQMIGRTAAQAARAGRMANIAGGAGLGGSMASIGYTQRVLEDPNIPPEQKQAIIEAPERWGVRALGSALGAIAPDIATPGRAIATRLSPAYRAAATPEALAAAQGTRGTLNAAIRGGLNVGTGMGVMGAGQTVGTNALYNSATGQNNPIFQGAGDAFISGAVTGGLLGAGGAAVRQPRVRRAYEQAQAQQAAAQQAQAEAQAQLAAIEQAHAEAQARAEAVAAEAQAQAQAQVVPTVWGQQRQAPTPFETQYTSAFAIPGNEPPAVYNTTFDSFYENLDNALYRAVYDAQHPTVDVPPSPTPQSDEPWTRLFTNFPTDIEPAVNRLAEAIRAGLDPDSIRSAGSNSQNFLSKQQRAVLLGNVNAAIKKAEQLDSLAAIENANRFIAANPTPTDITTARTKLEAQALLYHENPPATVDEAIARLNDIADTSGLDKAQALQELYDYFNNLPDTLNSKDLNIFNDAIRQLGSQYNIITQPILPLTREAVQLLNRRGLFNNSNQLEKAVNDFIAANPSYGLNTLLSIVRNNTARLTENQRNLLEPILTKAVQNAGAKKGISTNVQKGATGNNPASAATNSGMAAVTPTINQSPNAGSNAQATNASGATTGGGISGATPQGIGTNESNLTDSGATGPEATGQPTGYLREPAIGDQTSDASTGDSTAQPVGEPSNVTVSTNVSPTASIVEQIQKSKVINAEQLSSLTPEDVGTLLHNDPNYYTNNTNARYNRDLKRLITNAANKVFRVKQKKDLGMTLSDSSKLAIEDVQILNGLSDKEAIKFYVDSLFPKRNQKRTDIVC